MIQIDMDMPKNCARCPCGNAQDGWCYVHDEVLERTEKGYPDTTKRPDWCPIREVKHGKWIAVEKYGLHKCSVCKHEYHIEPVESFKFCPNCGADMRTDR